MNMNEILKAIPVLFNQRKPVTMPARVDLTALTINKTNRQFERAFIQITSHDNTLSSNTRNNSNM
jgi:hypothetical protein